MLEAITHGKSGHLRLNPYRGDLALTEISYDDRRLVPDTFVLPKEWSIVSTAALAAANARIKELEAQLAAAQPVQISPLERLEAWRKRRCNRRWEISQQTNTATVTLIHGDTAYNCMQPTLDAAINGAFAWEGADNAD